jgi:hypothetical protein
MSKHGSAYFWAWHEEVAACTADAPTKAMTIAKARIVIMSIENGVKRFGICKLQGRVKEGQTIRRDRGRRAENECQGKLWGGGSGRTKEEEEEKERSRLGI